MGFWNKGDNDGAGNGDIAEARVKDGSMTYVAEEGGNNAPAMYQEATGAPVEAKSPLGYSVGPMTITFMNVSMLIGTGIFSTPSSILSGTGSVGLSFIYWTIGYLLCLALGCVYLEFTAYFPSRSGSEVVFLEQAYPRPLWFFPTTFAFQSVILSFSSSNAIVLARYIFKMSPSTGTDWQIKGVAIAGYTVAIVILLINTKFSYYLGNAIGVVKVGTLLLIIISGFVVLGGNVSGIDDPKANFRDSFHGTGEATGYGLTIALYRIIFSYGGYNNAFNVVNEIKDPVRNLKKYAFIALTSVYVLYMFTNVAYYAAIPKAEIESSELTTASLFFSRVFGTSAKVRGFNFLITLSAFGNLLAVAQGASRMIRECGRQGVLPFPRFWSSTWPFGTPLGPYFVKWFLTILMILAIPTGDAFNFVSDLSVYPSAAFNLAMVVGLFVVRWRRKRAGLPRPQFRAYTFVVVFAVLVELYLLAMPWYPPPSKASADVSFWYGTYVVTGIAILILCGLYYYGWATVWPRLRHYKLRQEVVDVGNGAVAHNIVKVPETEVEEWDAAHDAQGRPIDNGLGTKESRTTGFQTVSDEEEKVGKIVHKTTAVDIV